MRRLSTYLFNQTAFAVLTVTVVLSCILWLVQTLRYVELISNKGVPIFEFLKMVLYLFPNIFVITVPIAVLVGILFVYNKLTADHELVIMRAAGLSSWQLAKPALHLSLLLTLFLYLITIYFLPFSFRKHRDMVLTLRQESLMSLMSDGQFSTFKNYTVYAHRQEKPGHFSGVLLYDATEPEKPTFFTAEQGVLFKKEGRGGLLLHNGSRLEQDSATGKPSILYFKRYVLDSNDVSLGSKKEERVVKAYERDMYELLHPPKDLEEGVKREFLATANQKLISPLYALVFGFLGVCGILLGQFSRGGRTNRILLACVLAALIEAGGMICLYGLNYSRFMLIGCYMVIFFPMGICLALLTLEGRKR